MKNLIDYITEMPKEDASHEVGHKYPFTVKEIFSCELNSILEKFFEAPEKKVVEAPEVKKDKDVSE